MTATHLLFWFANSLRQFEVDGRHPETPNIDDRVWCEYIDPHEIDKHRPSGKKHRTWASGDSARRIRRGRHPLKDALERMTHRVTVRGGIIVVASLVVVLIAGRALALHVTQARVMPTRLIVGLRNRLPRCWRRGVFVHVRLTLHQRDAPNSTQEVVR